MSTWPAFELLDWDSIHHMVVISNTPDFRYITSPPCQRLTLNTPGATLLSTATFDCWLGCQTLHLKLSTTAYCQIVQPKFEQCSEHLPASYLLPPVSLFIVCRMLTLSTCRLLLSELAYLLDFTSALHCLEVIPCHPIHPTLTIEHPK